MFKCRCRVDPLTYNSVRGRQPPEQQLCWTISPTYNVLDVIFHIVLVQLFVKLPNKYVICYKNNCFIDFIQKLQWHFATKYTDIKKTIITSKLVNFRLICHMAEKITILTTTLLNFLEDIMWLCDRLWDPRYMQDGAPTLNVYKYQTF